jgi:cell division inhibitor SepF
MSSLFSKALVYLGLVDEDQLDAETAQRPQPSPLDDDDRRSAEPVPQGRRVEPPPTSRTATRPAGRNRGIETMGLVHPVEIRSDILVVDEFGDARILADRVRARTPVVLDLRQASQDLVRRVVDFSSGLIYALDGSMRKVGEGLVLVLPPRVALGGDEKRRLASLGAYELDDIDY